MEAHDVAGGDVVGVEEFLDLLPAAVDPVSGVLGIVEDRPDCGVLPAVSPAVAVLVRCVRRGARDAVTIQRLAIVFRPRPSR